MSVPPTPCKKWQEQILEAVEGLLESRALEEHLSDCQGCQAFLEQVSQIQKSMKHLPEEELPEGFDQRFFQKLAQEPEPRKPWGQAIFNTSFWIPNWSWGLAAAAGFAFAIFITQPPSTSDYQELIAQEIDFYENLDLLESLEELDRMEDREAAL